MDSLNHYADSKPGARIRNAPLKNTDAHGMAALGRVNDAGSDDDIALLRQAKAGDRDAFEALVNRHEQRVFNLARRITNHQHDAEDVTQQTFLSALENLEGFRGEAKFSTWLLRIATHAALKVLRKRRGLPTVSLEENTEPQDGSDTIPHPEYLADWRECPEQLVRRSETRQLIDDALNQLDAKHRVVFLLRDVEGVSIRDTSDTLGLSEANVKVRLLRARLQLREQLTRMLGDPTRSVKIPVSSRPLMAPWQQEQRLGPAGSPCVV